jgi:hypothetical protein
LIDGTKIWIKLNGNEYALPKGGPLHTMGVYNKVDGEILNSTFGGNKEKGLTFHTKYTTNKKGEKIPSILQIDVSLHKMSNDFKHNYNDLSYSSLVETINTLSNWFGLNPNKMNLVNLEYGLNLKLNINTPSVLENLIFNQKEPFQLVSKRPFLQYQCAFSQRFVKAYDKGEQNAPLPYNLLRFENKYMKSAQFNRFGIYTIEDLKDLNKLKLLQEDLLRTWNECILYEPPLIGPKDIKEEMQLLKWQSPKYWNSLKFMYRNKFSDERRQFDKYIIERTANIKQDIATQIQQKWTEFETNSKEQNNSQKVQIYTLDIMANCTSHNENDISHNQKECLITGEDISDQKKGSKFLSAKKIGYKSAHDLRNKNSNPRNNLKRKIENLLETNSLFDNSELIKLNEDQKESLKYWNGTQYDLSQRINLNK